jgi:hypothetical protein
LHFYLFSSSNSWLQKTKCIFSIFLLNLFLGFTVIGWVVALVWAYTKDPKMIVNDSKSASQKASDASDLLIEKKRELYKDLESIKSLFDQNIISEEAYNEQKDSLLKKLDRPSNNESSVNTPLGKLLFFIWRKTWRKKLK